MLRDRPKCTTYHLVNAINKIVSTSPDATTDYLKHCGIVTKFPVKKIYHSPPHGTADNHFSGDAIMDYAGRLGFGLTTTCRRDRFPPGLKNYVYHDARLHQKINARGV